VPGFLAGQGGNRGQTYRYCRRCGHAGSASHRSICATAGATVSVQQSGQPACSKNPVDHGLPAPTACYTDLTYIETWTQKCQQNYSAAMVQWQAEMQRIEMLNRQRYGS
jgi:hypothetical protein